ncbi:hypothetical protein XHV734_0599 [Xanthomonas hortorum pv. vitians]|nr:hypothetical protein XHV734_0599 [Xanthomonas hortorum pv. vitians]
MMVAAIWCKAYKGNPCAALSIDEAAPAWHPRVIRRPEAGSCYKPTWLVRDNFAGLVNVHGQPAPLQPPYIEPRERALADQVTGVPMNRAIVAIALCSSH